MWTRMKCRDCYATMPQSMHMNVQREDICRPCRELRSHYIECYASVLDDIQVPNDNLE